MTAKSIWQGWIIEESLADKKILSKMNITNTMVEENTEADEKRIWTLHTVEVADGKIAGVSKDLEKTIKKEWYAHFTDKKNLIIIFHGKRFRFKIRKITKENETGSAVEFIAAGPEDIKVWKTAFAYGTTTGKVDSRYIVKVTSK